MIEDDDSGWRWLVVGGGELKDEHAKLLLYTDTVEGGA